MATGLSAAAANSQLDALVAIYDWAQLHTGEPGANGTANVATEDTRQQAAFGSATGGEVATNADLLWENVAASETYTHFSVWTASTAGTFGWSGAVTADAITLGQDFRVPTGDLTAAYDLATTV